MSAVPVAEHCDPSPDASSAEIAQADSLDWDPSELDIEPPHDYLSAAPSQQLAVDEDVDMENMSQTRWLSDLLRRHGQTNLRNRPVDLTPSEEQILVEDLGHWVNSDPSTSEGKGEVSAQPKATLIPATNYSTSSHTNPWSQIKAMTVAPVSP